LSGYIECGGKGGMTVAVGTSSSGQFVSNPGANNQYANAANHGQAWGEMIAQLNATVNATPTWADRLKVAGAIDIEPNVPKGWAPPLAAKAWVDSYLAASSGAPYFNVGSADGCTALGTGNCILPWTQQDIHDVSWGAGNAFPIPQIYANAPPGKPSNAQQWVTLATLNGGTPQRFAGVMTEWQACLDRPGPMNPTTTDPAKHR